MDQDRAQNLVLEHKRLKENLASLRNLVESYDSNEGHNKPAFQVLNYFFFVLLQIRANLLKINLLKFIW